MMPPEITIPFNRPRVAGHEIKHVQEAIARGQIAGDGYYTNRCHQWLENHLGSGRALLTHSCTAALEMAALLLNLSPGDEVIMPSFTFVSTANAVCLRGATPVFVDVDPLTLNIDPQRISDAITSRTRAIFVVHYAGVPCDMDEIGTIAHEHGISVVEDAAQALGSTYRGRKAGTLSQLAAFSFHETKNIISGEGGFLAVNDKRLAARAEILREKGTDRSQFFRGEVDKYSWVDIGSSFLPGELISAFLYGQLEREEEIRAHRLAVWQRYDKALKGLHDLNAQLPWIPGDREHNAHMYFLVFDDLERREGFIRYMRGEGIMTPFHYVPLHTSTMGRRVARVSGPMVVTERAAAGLVRLPLYRMSEEEQETVITAITKYAQQS